MSKSSVFVCQNCEASFPKWQGQCDNCGEWNSLVEQMVEQKTKGKSKKSSVLHSSADSAKEVVKFSEVDTLKGSKNRLSTGIMEFDRVLGSSNAGDNGGEPNLGMVPGSVMLIGGEPGIGKSTLLTQMVIKLLSEDVGEISKSKKIKTKPIIYICGEESPAQISLRISRIINNDQSLSSGSLSEKQTKKSKSSSLNDENLLFVSTTDVDEIIDLVIKYKPRLLIVDSIQTITTTDLTGASGSVGQLRECADRITNIAKAYHIPTFLVGHVTKEGTIAGPKVLEHIVDTVLELSGERTGSLRLLRAIKNRFGATDEVGVFQVAEIGLAEVNNPSQFFLEHLEKTVPGSAISCVMEGTRPFLLEVQALVVKSNLAMPRRVGRGIELSRIQVLTAVLQKHCGIPLGSTDVFLNAAGGFKVREPAVDLGLAMALVSSYKNKSLPRQSVFIGEVGLLGEIRGVSYLKRRIKEARRLGFKKVYSKESHQSIKELLKELNF